MLLKITMTVFLCGNGSAISGPSFENRVPELGLSQQYTGGWEHFVGGGVASFDCDGDLFPELLLAGGASPATLLRNVTTQRGAAVGFVAETADDLALTQVIGAYPLDVDSDGILDLFILRVGENRLLKGGADCSFSNFPDFGFKGGQKWTTAFSATWEGENKLPTLAVGNYVDRDDPQGPFQTCDENYLFRPYAGQYEQITLSPGLCPLSMLFSDWGRQGRQDLRISNDRHYYVNDGGEQLWAMENAPRPYGKNDGWDAISIWGMGIASRDISGDGVPEIFLTNMADQKLQLLDIASGGPRFQDVEFDRGTTAHRPYTGDDTNASTGWHVAFGDIDNDGLDDVFIAKGNVEDMPGSAMKDPNNLLIQSADGTFVENGLEAGVASMERSRGAAMVDMNLDGRLDLVVVNRNAMVEIYQNTTPSKDNWLLVDIRQDGVNTNAVGGWIEISDGSKTWHREITVGGGHASGNAALIHFGLGTSRYLKIRMIRPGGMVSPWADVSSNKIVEINFSGDELIVSGL